MNKPGKISDAELEIMRVLWNNPVAMTANTIRSKLQEQKAWDKSTVLTLIKRLTEKRAIRCEKKELLYYSAIVTEQEYAHYYTQNLVDKLYNGSLKNYVLSLCDKNNLTSKEIDELREFFMGGIENE